MENACALRKETFVCLFEFERTDGNNWKTNMFREKKHLIVGIRTNGWKPLETSVLHEKKHLFEFFHFLFHFNFVCLDSNERMETTEASVFHDKKHLFEFERTDGTHWETNAFRDKYSLA